MDLACARIINCDQGSVRAVRYNVDGEYCLTCGADRRVKLWSVSRGLFLKTYAGHGGEVLDAAGSCDSSQLVSCSRDKSVILWDVTTGQPLRRYRGHAAPVVCVKFNEESSLAISGSQDNSVHVWDVRSRNTEAIFSLKEAKDCITSLAVTDHEIFSSSVDCKVRCYDLRIGRMFSDFLGEAVTCLALTNDSQCILASCADDTLRLMDKDTGELLEEYKGHTSKDYSLECGIIDKDQYILSGSADGKLHVWELASGKSLPPLTPLTGTSSNKVLQSLSVHPTKVGLVTATSGNVYVWVPKNELEVIEEEMT